MKRVLITGGSGYLGQHIVNAFLVENYDVTVYDLLPFTGAGKVRSLIGDVRDTTGLSRITGPFDVVVHNSAKVPIRKSGKEFAEVNVDGTRNVIDWSRKLGVRSFVFVSSSAVYGLPKSLPVVESTPTVPLESYGRSKLEGERIALGYAGNGMTVSVIRPRTILGGGRLGIFSILFDWVRQGRSIPVLAQGSSVFQFVHADDISRAILLAARSSVGGVFNIGCDEYSTMGALLKNLSNHAGTGSKVRMVPNIFLKELMTVSSIVGISPLGAYHALMYGESFYFDTSKAKSVLGWSPKYSNDQMIKDSYDHYIQASTPRTHNIGSPHSRGIEKRALKFVPTLISFFDEYKN